MLRRTHTLLLAGLILLATPFTASAAIPVITIPADDGVAVTRSVSLHETLPNPDPLMPAPEACANALNGQATAAQQEKAMRCIINKIREKDGLGTVKSNKRLNSSAAKKETKLIACDDFSHTPCGQPFSQPFTAAGYTRGSWGIAENLAWGERNKGVAYVMADAWLKSPGHRKNMLAGNWRDQGVSMTWVKGWRGTQMSAVWVSHFGYKR